MFRRYRLNESELINTLKNDVPTFDYLIHKLAIEKKQKSIAQGLQQAYVDGFGYDADLLQQSWFPMVKGAHVFISHSHADKDFATNLAIWLKHHFGIEAFIDSYIWGYALDLQKKIDEEHCLQVGKTTYDYDKRNFTTSHVHLMLANSLTRMLDECECLMFIQSSNSLLDTTESDNFTSKTHTASPWIMHELNTSTLLRSNPKIRRVSTNLESRSLDAMEMILEKAGSRDFSAFYKLDLEQLLVINRSNIESWSLNDSSKGYHALTELYNIKGDTLVYADRTLSEVK
ncbi:toll/interleukin-1 receptor domain-containing protein [Moritella sp. 28]|uniref:toll/interleukin-1 receptor domain-containing protein n=1 Tax=Moritella sp. 28 TaxID=2746232 RepID=UPI001BAD35E5|nr:toll/interleukin-1 receptor domain-containing protein [Moritella sp. 28]QUM86156.1 hypothetical protein HWV02_17390 [Moritella sp. 28]